MGFLPPPTPSPNASIGKGILGIVGIIHASGVPTIIGTGENDKPATVLSSLPPSCLYIEEAAEPQSFEV